MLQKNAEAAERKARRLKNGTFIGLRPHADRLKVRYDRKRLKAADRRERGVMA